VRGVPDWACPVSKWRTDLWVAQRWACHNYGRRNCPGGDLEAELPSRRRRNRQGCAAKGVHFLLGPGVIIYRAPMNGRNFEYLGERPFSGRRESPWVTSKDAGSGSQRNGQAISWATIRSTTGITRIRPWTNARCVKSTCRSSSGLREAYVGAIMDSYNLTTGAHDSERLSQHRCGEEGVGFQRYHHVGLDFDL